MTTRDVKSDAARLLNTVAQGGVGIFATDVGYAIIGNGEAAIARIFACKQRNFDKACGMFSNWDMFVALAGVGERERAVEYLATLAFYRRDALIAAGGYEMLSRRSGNASARSSTP